jgi:tetratricopeptide (TPR) repeat protein
VLQDSGSATRVTFFRSSAWLVRILGVTRAMETVGRIGPLIEKSDFAGALKLAQAALLLSPEDDMALVAIADINLRQGMKVEALKAIEQAIVSNPAQRGQLRQSKAFASLAGDPEFQRLTR